MKKLFIVAILFISVIAANADTGYNLWLRYAPIKDVKLLQNYLPYFKSIYINQSQSATLKVALDELQLGIKNIAATTPNIVAEVDASILVGTPKSSALINQIIDKKQLQHAGDEGFIINSISYKGRNKILITANTDIGVLYGVFHFLRLVQMQKPINKLSITSAPKIKNRLLNHWDNLNRHVERGYAGISLWNWHTLPGYIDQRYIDYARANASIGINGTVLTNVNANALILTKEYLIKVAALANAFRPYGIKVYLTARFSAPIEIGKLKTADPLNADVKQWWKDKVDEIYQYVPDFGGFLVKANSEGQPGPQNYDRNHADGANMLADAVAPHKGIIMWRAFVYSNDTPEDRFKQAYNEFKPLDGSFKDNVLVQVKNGPIDFQPREPFSPLFGAMPKTPLVMEFQITQEYLGQSTSLVYEAPMFKDVLDADTYQKGKGSTVAKVIDGSLHNYNNTGIAGVSNIGNDINWTGHLFGQSNWYALGRLAWDHNLSSEQIADEWLKQTFTTNNAFVSSAKKMMLGSHEALVNYMTPLGLHHIMGTGHHYGPAPWVNNVGRADWNPVYYHRADSIGLGFNRTATGSNALAQYAPEVRAKFENINTCPEEYILWFHHVPWNHTMKSGRSLWMELVHRYYAGVDSVRSMQKTWDSLKPYVDAERHHHVSMLLSVQEKEAVWWRNANLLYFQTFSKMPIPANYEQLDQNLEYYKSLRFPFAPGNG